MNRRMPTTAGIDQLSLNLSVTRSPGSSVLASVLLWPPGALGGGITTSGFFFLTGCLEVARGMAQCGGPALAALGGLCEGGSLLTGARGTSVGGAAGPNDAVGTGGVVVVGSSAVPDTAGLMFAASLLLGPPGVVLREACLLGGCAGVCPSLGRLMRCIPRPRCSLVNRLMTASCSSGALSGSWPITMYRFVRKLM